MDNALQNWRATAIGTLLLLAFLIALALIERAGYWPEFLESRYVLGKIPQPSGMCGFSYDALNVVLSKRYDEAISLYTEQLSEPGLGAETAACLLRERARAYGLAGQDLEAERDYSAAVDLLPDDPDVYRDRGRFYFHRDRIELAELDFDRGFSAAPDDWHLAYWLGRVKIKQDELDPAIEFLTKAADLDPSHGVIFVWRGYAHARMYSEQNAYDDYTLAINSEDISKYYLKYALYQRAAINYNLGKHDLAYEDFVQIVELDPDYKDASQWRDWLDPDRLDPDRRSQVEQ